MKELILEAHLCIWEKHLKDTQDVKDTPRPYFEIHGSGEQILKMITKNAAWTLSMAEYPNDFDKQLERRNELLNILKNNI